MSAVAQCACMNACAIGCGCMWVELHEPGEAYTKDKQDDDAKLVFMNAAIYLCVHMPVYVCPCVCVRVHVPVRLCLCASA